MRKIQPPQYLPLNVIDRQFLVPETDDFSNGSYLPMTIAAVVHPRIMPTVASIQDALIWVDNKFSHFRLSYTLDPKTPRWIRVSDENRIEYLRGCVQEVKTASLDEHLAAHVQHNLSPLEYPLKIFICNESLCIHLYHPFGDANFLFQFTASLLIALYKPDPLEQLNNRFSIPLTEVVMSNFPQIMRVLGHMAKRISEKTTNYISLLKPPPKAIDSNKKSEFQATVSGTSMHVTHIEIRPDTMRRIRSIVQNFPTDQKISLNTYWQVFFAFRMNKIGLVDWPIELTTLVNLKRYTKKPISLYPGNCIGNIRLKINKASFVDACLDYQTQLHKQIKNAYPLADIVGNWFLALAGDKIFKQAIRNWYLKANIHDKRFFTLTNAGRLDEIFEPVKDHLIPDIRLVTPIMGSAPLVIAFTSYNNFGHFTATYKPDILSKQDILQIINFDMVTPESGKIGSNELS